MKIHLKLISLLFTSNLLITSCILNSSESITIMESFGIQNFTDGFYCFKYNGLDSDEYLTFQIDNNSLTGTLYLYDEYFGDVFYDINGYVNDDTLFLGNITTESAKLNLKWSLLYYGDSLLVKDLGNQFPYYGASTSMISIKSEDLPN